MTLGTLQLRPTRIQQMTIVKQNLNEAVDGSVYGYFFGKRKRFQIQLDFLSEEQKTSIEEMLGQKVELVLDNGEKYNVRISGNTINWKQTQLISGEYIYSTLLTLEEVIV